MIVRLAANGIVDGIVVVRNEFAVTGMLRKEEQRRTFLQATLQEDEEAFFLLVEDDRDVVRWFHCG